MAQRVMNLADAGNVLLSRGLHDKLALREKYIGRFASYTATVKHGESLPVYQYINPEWEGLNSAPPRALQPQRAATPRMNEFTAHYFGNIIKHTDFIKERSRGIVSDYPLTILLYYLAEDAISRCNTKGIDKPTEKLDYEKPLDENLREIERSHYWMKCDLHSYIAYHLVQDSCRKFLLGMTGLAVSDEGIQKLRADQPDIARQYGLLQPKPNNSAPQEPD